MRIIVIKIILAKGGAEEKSDPTNPSYHKTSPTHKTHAIPAYLYPYTCTKTPLKASCVIHLSPSPPATRRNKPNYLLATVNPLINSQYLPPSINKLLKSQAICTTSLPKPSCIKYQFVGKLPISAQHSALKSLKKAKKVVDMTS